MDLSRKKSFYRSKSTKTLILQRLLLDRSDRSDPPVRPVGPCRTGHSAPTGQTAHGCREDPMRTPHGRIRRRAVGIRSRVCIFFCFLCRGFQNLMGFLSFSGEVSLDLLVFIFLLLSDLIDLGLKHETETK